jgi:hypothetical protein
VSDIYDKIQGILETTLASIPDIPDIAWEHGEDYEPTTGVAYVKPTFLPTLREASVLGVNPLKYYRGLFHVDCMVPKDSDRATKSALVSKVIDAFDISDDLVSGDNHVLIRQTERDQSVTEGPFNRTTVRISWQSYA